VLGGSSQNHCFSSCRGLILSSFIARRSVRSDTPFASGASLTVSAGLGHSRDFEREPQWHDHQRLFAVASDDKNIAPLQPVIKLTEAVRAHLRLDAWVAPEQGKEDVAAEPLTADATAKRNALGAEAGILSGGDKHALFATSLLTVTGAAHCPTHPVRTDWAALAIAYIASMRSSDFLAPPRPRGFFGPVKECSFKRSFSMVWGKPRGNLA
jgi:hypothetical protein